MNIYLYLMKMISDIGNRICIIGFSCSGKSTLAFNLSKKLHLPVLFLDAIAHVPHTNWEVRDRLLLKKEHDLFIKNNEQWIIEGNYSFLMPDRFNNADIIIGLDYMNIKSILRYFKRCALKKMIDQENQKAYSMNLIGSIL